MRIRAYVGAQLRGWGAPIEQVMIAACDTFRSGAVEQLKTHCVRLGVPLYERGYEKDPAKVAFEAQRAAERNKKDVLLVDTAGAAHQCFFVRERARQLHSTGFP